MTQEILTSWQDQSKTNVPLRVLVVGAGFSGIGMGVELLRMNAERAGRRFEFVIVEKGPEVGGTWFWNQYPGCACDVVSPLYSFSWAPNPRWSTVYPKQPEILQYLKDIVQQRGLSPYIQLRTEVTHARWLDDASCWAVTLEGGQQVFPNVLVSGMGGLHHPSFPDIPGRQAFQGSQFHTTRWDPAYDPAGRRIAVIGSGASAVQVVPEIRKTAEHVTVIQRTANWMIPRYEDGDYREETKQRFERFPILMWLVRLFYYFIAEIAYYAIFQNPDRWTAKLVKRQCVKFIRHSVHDRSLAEKLVPPYAIGCKRVLITHQFYESLNEPNVTLDDQRVASISDHEVVMENGDKHAVDTIVWATGFDVMRGFPVIIGQNNLELNQVWQNGDNVISYLGITIPQTPNFFMLLGPNTGMFFNLQLELSLFLIS